MANCIVGGILVVLVVFAIYKGFFKKGGSCCSSSGCSGSGCSTDSKDKK